MDYTDHNLATNNEAALLPLMLIDVIRKEETLCIKRGHFLALQTENCSTKAVTRFHLFLNCFLQ